MGIDNILCCGSMPMYSPIEDFIDADCGCGSYPPGTRREGCDINEQNGTTDEHHLSKTAGNALQVTPPPSSQSSSQRVSGKFISLR